MQYQCSMFRNLRLLDGTALVIYLPTAYLDFDYSYLMEVPGLDHAFL